MIETDGEKATREFYAEQHGKAEAGDASACMFIANEYQIGRGGVPDRAKAFHYFQKADKAGLPVVALMVGYAHFDGDGVERDYAKAVECFRRAADHENPEIAFLAANEICRCYINGLGVERNQHEATSWRQRAVKKLERAQISPQKRTEYLSHDPLAMSGGTMRANAPDWSLFVTDADGTRFYLAPTKAAMKNGVIAFFSSILILAGGFWSSMPTAMIVGGAAALGSLVYLFVHYEQYERLKRERSYRELDSALAQHAHPAGSQVVQQQPHGSARDAGTI